MRKFLAGIMAIIIMIGTLAPVTFGLGGVEQKKLEAANNPVFWRDIQVQPFGSSGDAIKVSGYILYASKKDPTSNTNKVSDIDSDISMHISPADDPDSNWRNEDIEQYEYVYNVEKKIEQAPINNSMLKNLEKDKEYVFWFEEENQQTDNGDDIQSDKITFKISDLLNGVPPTVIPSINNGGSVKRVEVKFNTPPLINPDTAKPLEYKSQINTIYYSSTDDPGDSVDIDDIKLKYVLINTTKNQQEERAINVASINFKYGELKNLSFPISTPLTSGDTYKLYIYDEQFKAGNIERFRSNNIEFIAGDPNSVQENTVSQAVQTDENPAANEGIKCSFSGIGDAIFCNLVKLIVWLLNFVPNLVAVFTGILSDFLLNLAINPKIYGASYDSGVGSFIYGGWKIVRDISNILFIFALFLAAFMLIANQTSIGKTGFEPKKIVGKVIIMALLVNFSLFFCRMIIQTADVFSHVLYNQITNTSQNKDGVIEKMLEKAGVKSASYAIITQVNPQQLFIASGISNSDPGSYTDYLAVGVLTFFMYFILISIFVSMGILWVGRIAGLWLGMILSPIAFVSWSIPFIEDNKYIGFTTWIKNFAQLAFLAPVYLFFVYLTAFMLNIGGLSDLYTFETTNGNWMVGVLSVLLKTALPLLIAMFVLMQGKKIAYDLSGQIGEMAGKLSGSVTSLALGAATGGTALMARQTLGRVGSMAANSKGLMNAEAQGGLKGWGAGMLRGAGKSTGAATFDIRNNKMAMDKFGQITGKMGEKIDLGAKGLQKEGGFAKEGGIENKPGEYRDYLAKQAEERKKKKADELSADLKAVQEKEQVKLQKEKDTAQTNLDSEKTKITTEVGEQSVDKIVDQATLNLAGINQLIADIDQKIVANGFNQTDLDTAQTNKSAADTALLDIDEKIKKNEELLKNGTAQQMTDASNKKAQLDQEKQDALKKQQDADAELALQQTKQTQHNELVKEKVGAEKNATSNKETIASFSKYAGKGMTVSQMKDQIGVDRMKAETSIKGKELQEAKKEEQKNRDKIKELEKKRQEAEKEGDLVEMDRLQGEIDEEKKKTKDLQDKTKGADSKFKAAHSDFKELEKGLENLENDYMKAQKDRLKPYEDMIQNLAIDIKQQQVNDKQEQEKLMNSLTTNYDNAATNRSGFMKGLSKTTSVFSAGRFGGSNFNNEQANNVAANYARTKGKGK